MLNWLHCLSQNPFACIINNWLPLEKRKQIPSIDPTWDPSKGEAQLCTFKWPFVPSTWWSILNKRQFTKDRLFFRVIRENMKDPLFCAFIPDKVFDPQIHVCNAYFKNSNAYKRAVALYWEDHSKSFQSLYGHKSSQLQSSQESHRPCLKYTEKVKHHLLRTGHQKRPHLKVAALYICIEPWHSARGSHKITAMFKTWVEKA